MKQYYAITPCSPDTEAKTAISTSKALIIVSVSFLRFPLLLLSPADRL